MYRALKINAQAFDEIRIITVPRFKESRSSGDEWRISARIEFYRKGNLIYGKGGAINIQRACIHLGYLYDKAVDDGHGMFAGEGVTCDQEGCSETDTDVYVLKEGWVEERWVENVTVERRLAPGGEYRRFCKKHRHRGNSHREDNDKNYEIMDRADPRYPSNGRKQR